MLHLIVIAYHDVYPDGSGHIHANCPTCLPMAGHAYRHGSQPPLPLHAATPGYVCGCFCVSYHLGNIDAQVNHTHSEMDADLASFSTWLDDMEVQLSTLAQALLDIQTKCSGGA